MELLPHLAPGWLNAWLPLAILYGIFGLLLLIFPRDFVARLYDRSGWTRGDYVRRAVLFPFALGAIGIFVFLPLKIGTWPFSLGLALFLAGAGFFFAALISFRRTPLDQPVTAGVYRFSRNPQVVGLIGAFLGLALAVGSWLMVGLVILMAAGSHLRIRIEERACLAAYGDPYREYLAHTPRYLLFK